ncbi:MAG: kinase-like domain-containing protein, partial [Lentinula lateritia]
MNDATRQTVGLGENEGVGTRPPGPPSPVQTKIGLPSSSMQQQRRPSQPSAPQQPSRHSPPADTMGRLKLSGAPEPEPDPFGCQQPSLPATPPSRYPQAPYYPQQQQQQQSPLSGPPPGARPPSASVKAPPAYAQEPSRPQTSPYELQPGAYPGTRPPGPPSPVQTKRRKVGVDDFNFLAVLGKGNFGKVMLAEEKKTNGLYAIKVLKKEFIIDNDEVESTRSEKHVFLAAAKERHPLLLGLHSCFQTETRVYFIMEYASGGDLMLHIQRKQFSLRQAKFYASEVLLALE